MWLTVWLGVSLAWGPAEDVGAGGVDTGGFATPGEDMLDNIVNGEMTSAFPEVASLASGPAETGPFTSFCTGSLVHPSWIVTAAHCLVGLDQVAAPGDRLWVVFGSDVSGGVVKAVEWAESIPHEQYNGQSLANDIGLVQLVRPVNDVDLVVVNDEPVDSFWIGTPLTFVGFGVTGTSRNDAGTKRRVDNPVVSVDGSIVYAESPDSGTCFGDSGGPSFESTDQGYEQVGVTSFGKGRTCESGAHGHTRLDSYLDWLGTYVPTLLTEPPPPPNQGGNLDEGFGFLDWGVEDPVQGLSGEWSDPGELIGEPTGCNSSSGVPGGLWWLALLLAVRSRHGASGS